MGHVLLELRKEQQQDRTESQHSHEPHLLVYRGSPFLLTPPVVPIMHKVVCSCAVIPFPNFCCYTFCATRCVGPYGHPYGAAALLRRHLGRVHAARWRVSGCCLRDAATGGPTPATVVTTRALGDRCQG